MNKDTAGRLLLLFIEMMVEQLELDTEGTVLKIKDKRDDTVLKSFSLKEAITAFKDVPTECPGCDDPMCHKRTT